MPDENKKSRWDYLGKEPSELISSIPKESEGEVSLEVKLTKERMEKILQQFASEQQWNMLPPDQGTYEFKSRSFTDARLFARFDISPGGTTYLNFIFVIGGILNEGYAYELLRMNSGGFMGSPFFFTIQEIEGHKFLRLESWFVIPKDASDEAMVSALLGAFGTLFAMFMAAPWEKMMKMGIDIFLFPENMQRR